MGKRDPSNLMERSVASDLAEIAGRLSHRALQVTTPVCRSENRVPVPEGTGVLFALGDIRFLLTAAHVLEHLQDGGLSAQAGATLAYIGGDVTYLYDASGGVPDEDLVDIRIVRLAGRDWLDTPLDRFLGWNELDHEPANPQRHGFGLIGYPSTKQPGRPNGTTMKAYAYQVLGLECESTVYKQLRANPNVSGLQAAARQS